MCYPFGNPMLWKLEWGQNVNLKKIFNLLIIDWERKREMTFDLILITIGTPSVWFKIASMVTDQGVTSIDRTVPSGFI